MNWRLVLTVGRAALGSALCWWAVRTWLWFRLLPLRSDARMCGNCFLSSVGVPVACGAIGAILLLQIFSSEAWRVSTLVSWPLMLLGIITMPQGTGALYFLAGLV